jgi:hypothetical protein
MTKAISRKLGLNPGMRALVIAPPPGYLELLKPLPEGLTVSSKPGEGYPFVQVFATRLSDVSKFAKRLRKYAALWYGLLTQSKARKGRGNSAGM